MHLPGQTYPGAPLDDLGILDEIPAEFAQLLAQRNGFVAFGGALHVRGACTAPAWHSIRSASHGEHALHRLFPAIDRSDAPFGQDALGNQFIIRGGAIHRLAAAAGAVQIVEFMATGVAAFLLRCMEEPAAVLPLDQLARLSAAGGRLEPGQLLEPGGELLEPDRRADRGAAVPRAVPALERIRSLAAGGARTRR